MDSLLLSHALHTTEHVAWPCVRPAPAEISESQRGGGGRRIAMAGEENTTKAKTYFEAETPNIFVIGPLVEREMRELKDLRKQNQVNLNKRFKTRTSGFCRIRGTTSTKNAGQRVKKSMCLSLSSPPKLRPRRRRRRQQIGNKF